MFSKYRKSTDNTKILLMHLLLNGFDIRNIEWLEDIEDNRQYGITIKKVYGITRDFVDVKKIEQEIEHIRGVRAEKVVLKLLEQDLIKELGRKDTLGRPILYGTTDTFLKCFGLNNLTDLPELPQADMSQLSPEQLEYLEQKVPEPADKEV